MSKKKQDDIPIEIVLSKDQWEGVNAILAKAGELVAKDPEKAAIVKNLGGQISDALKQGDDETSQSE